jgi:hypothetical protein
LCVPPSGIFVEHPTVVRIEMISDIDPAHNSSIEIFISIIATYAEHFHIVHIGVGGADGFRYVRACLPIT